MAPGGELNEKSIEFVMQSAQAVIQQQCEVLYDPRKHVHRDICYEIVNESQKANFEIRAGSQLGSVLKRTWRACVT